MDLEDQYKLLSKVVLLMLADLLEAGEGEQASNNFVFTGADGERLTLELNVKIEKPE